VSILVTGAAGFAGSHVVEALGGSEDVVGWTHHAPAPQEPAAKPATPAPQPSTPPPQPGGPARGGTGR